MPCCSDVDIAEDIQLSPTIKKAMREVYFRDKNYLDVLRKLERREFVVKEEGKSDIDGSLLEKMEDHRCDYIQPTEITIKDDKDNAVTYEGCVCRYLYTYDDNSDKPHQDREHRYDHEDGVNENMEHQYFKIPGHNLYVRTKDNKPDGEIVEIGKIHRANQYYGGLSFDTKYLVQRGKELYGNIVKLRRRERDDDNHKVYDYVCRGEMTSLNKKDKIEVWTEYSHMDYRHHRYQYMVSDINGLYQVYSHRFLSNGRSNYTVVGKCLKYFYQDASGERQSLLVTSRDGVVQIVKPGTPKETIVAFLSNSLRAQDIGCISSPDGLYNIRIGFSKKDTRRQKPESYISVPYLRSDLVEIRLDSYGSDIIEFFDLENHAWKTLKSDEDLMQFDKQLRNLFISDNGDIQPAYEAAYECVLKVYNLYDRVIELNKKKQDELQNAEEKKSANNIEEDSKSSNKSSDNKKKNNRNKIPLTKEEQEQMQQENSGENIKTLSQAVIHARRKKRDIRNNKKTSVINNIQHNYNKDIENNKNNQNLNIKPTRRKKLRVYNYNDQVEEDKKEINKSNNSQHEDAKNDNNIQTIIIRKRSSSNNVNKNLNNSRRQSIGINSNNNS